MNKKIKIQIQRNPKKILKNPDRFTKNQERFQRIQKEPERKSKKNSPNPKIQEEKSKGKRNEAPLTVPHQGIKDCYCNESGQSGQTFPFLTF